MAHLRVVAVAGGIGQHFAAGLVGRQVHHQARFASGQRRAAVVGNLLRGARGVPEPQVVDSPLERRVALGGAPDPQRVSAGDGRRVAQSPGRRFDAVEVDLHHAVAAVQHGCHVIPLAGDDAARCRIDGLVAAVARGQVQVALRIEPERVGALVAVAVALVEDVLPVAAETVDPQPGLQRHRSCQVDRVRVGHLGVVHPVEQHGVAQRSRHALRLQPIVLSGHDRGVVVGDLQQLEAVADRWPVLREPGAALDDQRVAAADGRREDGDVVQILRTQHLASERVEHAPGLPVGVAVAAGAGELLSVDVVARADVGLERIDVGAARGVELPADQRVGRERRGGRDVEQAEAEVALAFAADVKCQRVVARNQVQQRAGSAQFVRLGAVKAPVADLDAARTGQRPVQVRVGIRRHQSVKQQLLRLGQAEGVGCALPHMGDAARGGRANRQAGAAVLDLLDVERVAVGSVRAVGTALDQQRVGPGQREGRHVLIARPGVVAPDLVALRVEQPVGRVVVVAALAQHVKVVAVAGERVELVDIGPPGWGQGAVDRRAHSDGDRVGRDVAQREAVVARGVADAVDDQRVVPGRCPQQRVRAAQVGRVAARQVAARVEAVRAAQRPADAAATGHIREAVHVQAARRAQIEGVGVALPGRDQRGADRRAHDQCGRRAIDHLVQGEAVVVARRVAVVGAVEGRIDGPLHQQRVSAGLRQRALVDIVERRRPEHLLTRRVEQPPEDQAGVVGAERLAIDEHAIAGLGVEVKDVGFVVRVERAAGHGAERKTGARGEVEQAKRVGAGLRGIGAHAQLVGSRQQQVDQRIAAQAVRVAVVDLPVVDLGAARAQQRPAEVVVVARLERVEVQAGWRCDREHEGVDLAGRAQRAVDARAQRQRVAGQRRDRGVALQRDAERTAHGCGLAGTTLEQQRVVARQLKRQGALVAVEIGRAEDQPAERIEQAPVGVAAGAADPVEKHRVAGAGGEAEHLSLVTGIQRCAERLPVGDGSCRSKVEQAESEGARGIATAVNGQRVGAGAQRERGRAAEFTRVRIVETARVHHGPIGAAQRPVEIVVAAQRIEHGQGVGPQRERVGLALPDMLDAAVDPAAEHQGRGGVLHALQVEAVVGRVVVVDPPFQRQHIASGKAGREHVEVTVAPLRS